MNNKDDNTPSIKPDNATFHSLFLDDSKAIYYVPNFQRSYAWDVSPHVEQFLRDLKDCYEIEKLEGVQYQHFLGQFILRRASEHDLENTYYYEVIDGQQRLITFFMLCISIYEKAVSIIKRNRSLQSKGQLLTDEIQSILFVDSRCRLVLSRKDQGFWEELINQHTVFHGNEANPGKVVSHRKMLDAMRQISAFLEELLQGKDDYQEFVLLSELYSALLNRMHIIAVTSEPTEYMFALFQTVNDRGRLLTNGELLRAKTLESLRNSLEMQLQAEQCWDDILQDDEKTTDQILEWCYISFTGKEVLKNPSLFHQYIENYFVEAKKRHVNDEEMLSLMEKISNLKKDVTICRLLQTGTWPFMSDTRALWQKHRLHELVCRLRHTKAIPVLLSIATLERTISEPEHDKVYEEFYNIVDLIDRFFFVYKKISSCDEKNFNNAYVRYSYRIRSAGADLHSFSEELKKVEKEADCEYYLNSYLSQPIYSKKRVHATEMHLLYLLELYYSKEAILHLKSTMDDAVNIDVEKLSIEHIYPKSAQGERLIEELEPYKHCLGNLTLLGKGKNNDLDSMPFERKKCEYENSPFRITRDVSTAPEWSLAEYRKRQAHLECLAKLILTI